MRKFQIGYITPEHEQVTVEVHVNEETGTVIKNDNWAGILLTPPRTAMFADVITKGDSSVSVEYIYDVARTDTLSREYVLQNAGTLTFSTTEHNGFSVSIGKIEPMFIPSISAAVVSLTPSVSNGTSRTYKYKPTLLGFINQVSVLEA